MLCRTANDLYWTARHIERAENTARLVDVSQRIALLPERLDPARHEAGAWRRALDALGTVQAYSRLNGPVVAHKVLRYLCLDPANPSSIYSCIRAARESARAQRGAVTLEMYEDLNTSWIEMRQIGQQRFEDEGLPRFIEWVKTRSASFRGVTIGTLGRDDPYHFLRLGTFLERADWCVRLMDVKYSQAESEAGDARSALGYYQWSALLNALSAMEMYRRRYRETILPERVAELMILNPDSPRSLATCTVTVHRTLAALAGPGNHEVVRQAGALMAETRYGRIDDLFAAGMEGWLRRVMTRLFELARQIDRHFLLTPEAVK
ncbi:MAG: alpha-E domain-containing protein [Rudaea sp.]|uniref:alpha-E domain-containing protein n=1 Tax=unclassified Rudaea TaxID=2627037 RepID=UPI0010F630CD|nr:MULTISPECIES: alpha-E domain-containing protein [unclassified Rudaea]MBN8884418.1 alpha-E domain-containing protein [Rudaea sp.]MBR0344402.1 alpha-E domain-containing protein [Rudaea sp.]